MSLIRDTLKAGMTDNVEETNNYYIKKWYINDPVALDVGMFPFALIKPDDSGRSDLYVQEDAAVDDYVIHFFPKPITRIPEEETSPARQTEDMIDRAIELLREDPTLGYEGAHDVARRIYDVQVIGSTFKQPGFVGEGVYHSAELRVQAKRRAPWRI